MLPYAGITSRTRFTLLELSRPLNETVRRAEMECLLQPKNVD
jgi:hypothetical protein